MRGTMQQVPLSIATLLRYGSTVQGRSFVATATADGVKRTSYADLGRRAARLAHALRDDLGVTNDQRVATFMWNNVEHMEAYAAVPSMGAVLHTLNIRLFPQQVTYVANHAEDHVILVDGSLLPLFAKLLPAMSTVRHVVVVGSGDLSLLDGAGAEIHAYEELLAGKPEEFDWPTVDENDAAAMCYTSGTTGNPKGVAYSHRSMYLHSMQICTSQGFGYSDRDYVLAIVPMFHAMSWGLPYAALMSGASLLLPDRFLQAEPLVKMITQERPNHAAAVPTIWGEVLRYLDENPAAGDISSLRQVVVGGSALPPSMLVAFAERYGVQLVHAWGMTETSPLGSVSHPPHGVSAEAELEYRFSQGRLPASVEGRIIGPDGTALPHDGSSVGELEVRGPWVAAAYYGDDDPEKFRDGWLRTGDVGNLSPDGYVRLTDRAKDVIKSGGEWISSVELENLLMAHDQVVEAVVVGIPDPQWSERPLAGIVPAAGAGEDLLPELRTLLAGKVARWQVPEYWTLLESVPKTSVGKFDKKEVRRAHAAGELSVTELRD